MSKKSKELSLHLRQELVVEFQMFEINMRDRLKDELLQLNQRIDDVIVNVIELDEEIK